ncbi:unnamed protein product [Absidia cylindrospora]
MTSIHPDIVIPSSLNYIPLTTDNLMKKAQYELTASIPPTVLVEQYCQDMMTVSPNSVAAPMKRRKQRSASSSSHKIRPSSQRRQSSSIKSSTSTSRDNTVMESPRLLPFPYHNDSLFLPTVEQHRRMERAKSVASIRSSSSFGNPQYPTTPTPNSSNIIQSARSSTAFTPSLPPPPSPKRQRSAPPSLSRRPKALQHQPFNEVSIPSPLHTMHYQQKRNQQFTKGPTVLSPSSTSDTLPSRHSSSSSSKKQKASSPTLPYSWLRKVWKLLKKSSWRHRLSSSTKAMASVVS